tara:strand:- start:480 stop:635 length:156 start_codon:yes stop_codon:yes gene_type:complete
MGDAASASAYLAAAEAIEPSLKNHYNGHYVTQCDNRPKDSAVVNAFNIGYA